MSGWRPTAWRRKLIDDAEIEVRDWDEAFSVELVPAPGQRSRPRVPIARTRTREEALAAAEAWAAKHALAWAD